MEVEATTGAPLGTDADSIAVGVFDGEGIPHDLPGDRLGALLSTGEARSKLGHVAVTHAEDRRFILVGLGSREQFDAERARVAAGNVDARAADLGTRVLCWELPHHVSDEVAGALVEGTVLHRYRFVRYKPSEEPDRLERLLISAHHDVAAPARLAAAISAAQNRARDLANSPANELTPGALADYAGALAERFDRLTATVMDEEEIGAAGMGAFAAVAQGSAQPARLIVLRYDGPGASGPLVGLVGKAVTFDTGGLSLKPPAKMHEMKFDMAGGAAVIEAVAALAELQAPVRVLGVVGATENMPSGNAVKPGDIVRALDGTSIEINNTDAEGRLVLADCLVHARREGAERLIDVATLTGGVVVALGSVYAGLLSNDRAWAELLLSSGAATGELLWQLPLHERYAAMVKGRYAQLTNLTERREASTITGAEFLHAFAGETPWAHLDIAGTAYDAARPYLVGKGATGFGVRLLVHAVKAAAGQP